MSVVFTNPAAAETWHDAEDHKPGVVCMARYRDGSEGLARWICGDWEELDGRVVYPVAWRFAYVEMRTQLYGNPLT